MVCETCMVEIGHEIAGFGVQWFKNQNFVNEFSGWAKFLVHDPVAWYTLGQEQGGLGTA